MLQFHAMQVVILSRQARLYSTSRLAEAAYERGFSPQVVDPLSQVVNLHVHSPFRGLVQRAVIPRIGASITEFGCAVVRQYELNGDWVLNSAAGIARSRDKLLSAQVLAGSGLPIPRTAIAGRPEQLESAIAAVGGLPVVLKIRRGTQGKGVVLARTLAAARRVFSVLSDFQQYTLIQEFVAEAANRDIRVIVVGGQVVAAMEREAAPGDFRANLHRGGRAWSVQLTDHMSRMAVRAAGLHDLGLAGVDLISTARGPAVMEVNSSPGLKGIETASGVDVAGAVMDLISERVSERHRGG